MAAPSVPVATGPHRPVGIIAALLALGIAIGGALGGQAYAVRLAGRYLQAVNLQQVPIKWESLTFQRAAFASDHWLPLYGSSELYCCGDPYRGTQLFASMPSGFALFGVGNAGTTDLLFLETFGALGGTLRNEKVVISDSPQWYYNRGGEAAPTYAGNFSPEIAEAFVFNAPLSLPLREATARRMLAYPDTLKGRPLLHLALTNLASGTPLHLAGYFALLPAGRLDTLVKELQDAYQTVKFIRKHQEYRPDAPATPRRLDWSLLLTTGTTLTKDATSPDPFGFPADVSTRLRTQEQYRTALSRYCSGQAPSAGQATPFSSSWEDNMLHSAGWTDLYLELQALNELGAQPLVFTIPLPGLWYDEIGIPVEARNHYYQKYMSVVAQANVPALDMRANDQDRFFLHDTGAHFSPRGWIYANRAIDMFWHGRTMGEIRASLATMNRQDPPVGLPDPRGSAYCP